MGKQSTRKNKNIYQLCREKQGLTREKADDEIRDFAFISRKLDEVSLAIDSLNLWIDKTASENNINIDLLNAEKEKLSAGTGFNSSSV